MTLNDRDERTETFNIIRIERLKRGEVANIRWDENGKRYVIEIARRVEFSNNSD